MVRMQLEHRHSSQSALTESFSPFGSGQHPQIEMYVKKNPDCSLKSQST